MIQFGIAFTHSLSLTDAVRAGARAASVSRNEPDPGASAKAAVRRAAANLDPQLLTVSVSSTWQRGEPVTVSASYPYDIDLLGVVVMSGDLSSTTTERVE